MKLILLSAFVFISATASYSQTIKENGTIYIKHPYIDVINKSNDAYLAKDVASNAKFFSDTAKFWVSSMDKPMPIADSFKMWLTNFDFYDSIKVKSVGYPDYLAYTDMDQKYIQSWWEWSGKSKKTGDLVTIQFVQFDRFNKAGKIDSEAIYGEFSKKVKN